MKFSPNTPVETTKPTIVVDAGLPVGLHRFRLVVVSANGRLSRPTEVVIDIQPARSVIRGRIQPTGPSNVGP